MTDVLLFQTDDGGEVTIVNGRFTLDDGPATAAYLSLFGGNEQDGARSGTDAKQWWGNLLEVEDIFRYRSETQHVLRSFPAVSGNLRRVEDAANRDLAWMVSELGATLTVTATLPAINTVALNVAIEIDATATELRFEEPWGAAAT